MRVSVLILCAALFAAGPAGVPAARTLRGGVEAAQTPQQPPPVFRGGVELLTVDATVVDKDGRQIVDLKPGEFAVEVDGKARPVVSAEYTKLVDDQPVIVGAHMVPKKDKPPVEDSFFSTNARPTTGQGRLILLLVDQGNIRAGQGRQVMRSAVKFVDGLNAADRVALVGIPGPGPLVDFTTEHEKVREGLLATV